MCKKLIYLICLLLIVAFTSSSYGVVIGDFEGSLDAWEPRDATLSQSTTGATSGTGAMQVDGPGAWHINGLIDAKPYRQALGTAGVVITADVTAFDADMTTTWMQVEMVINAQNNDDAGAHNNVGWRGLGLQAVTRDGQPHTHTWALPEDLTAAIAGTDQNIWWFELALVSNLDAGSVTKFYIDNIQIISEAAPAPAPSGVFGDWENNMDGWILEPDLPGTTVEYSTTHGVTLNDHSLKMFVPGSGYQKTIHVNILENPQMLEAFRNGRIIQLDVTRLAAEWPGDIGWGGIIHMVINAGGDGWSIWEGEGPGWWTPDLGDRTETMEWDYSESLAKIDFDNIWWLEIFICPNCGGDTSGVYYFDNFRIPTVVKASEPNPADGATDVQRDPSLGWKPGEGAATHDVFFGPNMNEVANASKGDLASYPSVTYRSVDLSTYLPEILELGRTYYWRIDEVNGADVWPGDLWSFTVGEFLVVDDFESYNAGDNQIWHAWRDGLGFGTPDTPPYSAGNGTGSEVGDGSTASYTEQTIVHGGGQSMPYWYNNNKPDKAKYSEAKLTLTSTRNWTGQGVTALYLYFRGHPGSLGELVEAPAGTYTLTGAGADIWGTSDEFHYAWKMLDSVGSITAKVSAITNLTEGASLHEWAKAGVMIRETLEPTSKHAFMCVTGAQGISYQYRGDTASDSVNHAQLSDVSARPHWIKLERDISGAIAAFHADDVGGSPGAWQILDTAVVQMSRTVYIGLALTSHQSNIRAQAVFSNISTTGTVTGVSWTNQDIGIQQNEAEPMYVAIANSGGTPAVVYHPDPGAALMTDWTEWAIDLKEFSGQGVNLADVNSIAIGFGDRDNPQAGGSGKMYFDNIRLYRGKCILSERSAAFAKLDYAPAGDPAGDCMVDYQELEIMLRDWLMADDLLATQTPSTAGLEAHYPVNEGSGTTTADASGQGHQGTLNGNVTWVDGQSGFGKALEFPAEGGSYVDLGTWNPSQGTGQLTVAVWIKWAGLTGGYQGVVAKRNTWNSTQTMWQIELNNETGNVGFSRYDSYPGFGTNIPPVGQWQHVAVTFDGTTCEMYIDGKSVGTSTVFSFGPRTDANVVFGAVEENGGNPFNGTIDEVYIYNRALSSAEVAYLADDTLGDGQLHVPLRSVANVYDAEPPGAKVVNFMDFAVLAEVWLDESLWPSP